MDSPKLKHCYYLYAKY